MLTGRTHVYGHTCMHVHVLQEALVAPMAGYAAPLVSVAVSMVTVELLAMPPTAERGAKHHMGHAQAGFC